MRVLTLSLIPMLCFAHPAFAETAAFEIAPPTPKLMTKSEAGTGSLLIGSTTPGKYIAAPRLGMDVSIDISGPVARTTLIQSFTNPTEAWVEGVYVFPLPDTAAVDSLKLVVGDRLIEGAIKRRVEAKRIYEAAKAAGQTAALTEQERPNIFTNSVANIGPGETVSVRITYQETVQMQDDGFSLRFPMVVGPRFIPPAETVQMVEMGSSGFASTVTDSHRITPPLSLDRINPVTLRVDLLPGFEVGNLTSPSHAITTLSDTDGSTDITLDGEVFADRDFVLEWTPSGKATPRAGLFTETVNGADYHLLMLTPPKGAELNLPRDVTFILDVSGSMNGESIRQAKAGLTPAIERLGPEDRFNIIAFDSTTYPLWRAFKPADERNVHDALRWLSRDIGGGGTQMLPALDMALAQQRSDPDRLAQILFLTDGAIGNESALFSAIANKRGDARVFTIGMGSAPNTHFMRRAAELGQGTHTHIGDISEASDKMTDLTDTLARPVMTDITAYWPGDVVSADIPDLYAGEALTLTQALPKGNSGTLRITGQRAGEPWESQLRLGVQPTREGVSKLWARQMIGDLEVERLSNRGRSADAIDKEIVSVALQHSLVSRLTSLVAVDITPRRPAGRDAVSRDLPTMLPKGWEFAGLFGDARSVPDTLNYGKLIAPSADPASAPPAQQDIHIPQGSTSALLSLLAGLLLLIMAWMGRLRARV